jgi:3-hydroxy-3-methylglutaryl CoA synthase
VKQSEGIGRNVVDNFETALVRAKKKGGIIVALSFGKGAYEEAARAKLEQGVEIELKTVADILEQQ